MQSCLGNYIVTINVDATELRQDCKSPEDLKSAVTEYLHDFFSDGVAEDHAEAIVAQYIKEGLWK